MFSKVGYWFTSCGPPNGKHNIQNILTRLKISTHL